MRLFFALSAAMGFLLTPMPTPCRPPKRHTSGLTTTTPNADWYRSRHGKEINRSLVLPVLKALQGHPEAGALWEKHINKILDDLDILYTTHERSIYRGKIDGKVVLLCR